MRFLRRKPKALILNDTRRDAGHLGCLMVMSNLLRLCHETKIEVTGTIQSKAKPNRKEFSERLRGVDLVILNGEGTLHHDRGEGLLQQSQIAKEQGIPVALINSVWQDNPKTREYLRIFSIQSFRESTSMRSATGDGASRAICVPDLSFYSELERHTAHTDRLAVTDSVIERVSEHLEALAGSMNSPYFPMSPQSKCPMTVDQFMRSGAFVGGRFHALCLCVLSGKPALTVESNTHKVGALLEDLGVSLSGYFLAELGDLSLERARQFQMADHRNFLNNARDYSSDAKKKLRRLFKEIRSIR